MPEKKELLVELESMPRFLAETFRDRSAEAARRGGLDGAFSPVEQCWHLADLESEGFGVPIRLLPHALRYPASNA